MRRLAVGTALIGAVIAGGAAITVAGDDADGRDDGVVPGAPSDATAPAPDEADAGRAENSTPVLGRSGGATAAPAVGPLDNGRGGADPAFGPLPIPRESASTAGDGGGFDTDSGEAAVADAGPAAPSARSGPSTPADQDVPGAPTSSAAGSDAPANDQDG